MPQTLALRSFANGGDKIGSAHSRYVILTPHACRPYERLPVRDNHCRVTKCHPVPMVPRSLHDAMHITSTHVTTFVASAPRQNFFDSLRHVDDAHWDAENFNAFNLFSGDHFETFRETSEDKGIT